MYTWQIYKDTKKLWRLRIIARNGQVVGTFGESYTRRSHALKMAQKLSKSSALQIVRNIAGQILLSKGHREKDRLARLVLSITEQVQDRVVIR